MQLQQEKQTAKSNLLRKCGLLAHTSPAFLKNCWIKKLFICLRLVLEKPLAYGSARLGHIPSLPWKSQLPLKPYLSLQPSDFEGNCDSSDSLLDFCFISLYSSLLFASQMWATRPHLGSIFEKLLHRKTFSLPAALSLQSRSFYFNAVFHVKHCIFLHQMF